MYLWAITYVTKRALNFNDIILKSVLRRGCAASESFSRSELFLINSPPPRPRTDDCVNIYMFFNRTHASGYSTYAIIIRWHFDGSIALLCSPQREVQLRLTPRPY